MGKMRLSYLLFFSYALALFVVRAQNATNTTRNTTTTVTTTTTNTSNVQTSNTTKNATNSTVPKNSTTTNTLLDLIKADPDLSLILQALYRAGYAGVLADPNAVADFYAPTNAAMAKFAVKYPQLYNNLGTTYWILHLQNLLKFHYTTDLNSTTDYYLMANGEYTQLVGQDPTTGLYSAVAPAINGQATFQYLSEAVNGELAVIDNVLAPSWINTTAWDYIVKNFPKFAALARKAGLQGFLSTQALTLFIPSEAALRSIDVRRINTVYLRNLLLYHILSPQVLPAYLIPPGTSSQKTAYYGKSIVLQNLSPQPVKVNQATIIQSDILVNNGIIHVIDGVLQLPVDPYQGYYDGVKSKGKKASPDYIYDKRPDYGKKSGYQPGYGYGRGYDSYYGNHEYLPRTQPANTGTSSSATGSSSGFLNPNHASQYKPPTRRWYWW